MQGVARQGRTSGGGRDATFVPLTPVRLVAELARWVGEHAADGAARAGSPGGTVIGFDGPGEVGTTALADEVAEELRVAGLSVIRASTRWWWRPSALRLEFGREDVDMRLTGWVDAGAMVRELVDPVRAGAQPYITRLRDPETDRSIRETPRVAPPNGVLLVDGPFLLAAELPLDAMVWVGVGRGALTRALGPENSWWTMVSERYDDEYRPAQVADVRLSYDHPASPAASGLTGPGKTYLDRSTR